MFDEEVYSIINNENLSIENYESLKKIVIIGNLDFVLNNSKIIRCKNGIYVGYALKNYVLGERMRVENSTDSNIYSNMSVVQILPKNSFIFKKSSLVDLDNMIVINLSIEGYSLLNKGTINIMELLEGTTINNHHGEKLLEVKKIAERNNLIICPRKENVLIDRIPYFITIILFVIQILILLIIILQLTKLVTKYKRNKI